MEIRVMRIEDYNDVMDLWLNTKGMGLNNLDDSREGINKFIKRNPTTSFVANDNGKIVGVIIAGHDGRRGYIYHTAVAENRRKEGIGKLLISACMSALDNEGINKAALVVFEHNIIGNTFWEQEGFHSRTDLVYRNKNITEIQRIDT